MRFATFTELAAAQPGDGGRAGVVSDAGIHPLPDGVSVLDLVRARGKGVVESVELAATPTWTHAYFVQGPKSIPITYTFR